MTFQECVQVTIETPGFLKEYDRLNGTTFSKSGILHEIDVATGKYDEDAKKLFTFILEHIWMPVIECYPGISKQ